VKKHDGDTNIIIEEEGSNLKTVTLPSRRWAQFVEVMGKVDEAINSLVAKQYVHLNIHIGGKR